MRLPRCRECEKEIENAQSGTLSELCSECLQKYSMTDGSKIIDELVSYRNELEASLILLAITCFVVGMVTYIIFHPFLIFLSFVGAILLILTLRHYKKTKILREKAKQLRYIERLRKQVK